MDQVQESYDKVADEYIRRIYDELRGKPLDRELLAKFTKSIPDGGVVCDLGCGPGHVSRYLKDLGATVIGVDLSSKFVERARTLNPDIEFFLGDMLNLQAKRDEWDGILSFYSIVNIQPNELLSAFRQMHLALREGGQLLLAFHLGSETVHLEEWWNLPVNIDFHFFQSSEVTQVLRQAGFKVEEVIERDPYPEVEHQSRRAYIFCSK